MTEAEVMAAVQLRQRDKRIAELVANCERLRRAAGDDRLTLETQREELISLRMQLTVMRDRLREFHSAMHALDHGDDWVFVDFPDLFPWEAP